MKNTFFFLFLVCSAAACNQPSSNPVEELKNPMKTTTKAAAEFNGMLNELLTPEMAAAISGYDIAGVKEKYSQVLKDPSTHNLRYEWKKGRTRKIDIGNNGTLIPVPDFVEISWVKNTSLSKFKSDYRTPTPEELEKINAMMDKQMEGKVAEGKISQEHAGLGKGLAESLGKGVSFDPVANTGDYAVWNKKQKELKVFYNVLEFEITVELGDDETLNKEKSISLAKRIIAEKL
jgi:hypothetical protein